MIVDEHIFSYWNKRYGCKNPIERAAIIVNEDTEEAIVEIYLKQILVLPIPNESLFKFSVPKTILISRKENISSLATKIRIAINFYLYNIIKERSFMISEIRLWKSLTNNFEDIKINIDKKYKNFTQVKVDAVPLNITENDKN